MVKLLESHFQSRYSLNQTASSTHLQIYRYIYTLLVTIWKNTHIWILVIILTLLNIKQNCLLSISGTASIILSHLKNRGSFICCCHKNPIVLEDWSILIVCWPFINQKLNHVLSRFVRNRWNCFSLGRSCLCGITRMSPTVDLFPLTLLSVGDSSVRKYAVLTGPESILGE